jgi:hypothetical protein
VKKPWENDSCEQVQSYFTIYPVPVAAALWCCIPAAEVQEHLNVSTQVYRAVYRHPYIRCLEPRCRAIHEAIESGALPVSRESGNVTTDHVAPERRHVSRQNLKEWIAKEFPGDKPPFLFDEIERNAHAAINADSYRALQADRDAARAELEKAKTRATDAIRELDAMRGERDSLRAMVDRKSSDKTEPTGKDRNTMLRLIGGLAMAGWKMPIHERLNGIAEVVSDLSAVGVSVSEDTLRERLREAAQLIEPTKRY